MGAVSSQTLLLRMEPNRHFSRKKESVSRNIFNKKLCKCCVIMVCGRLRKGTLPASPAQAREGGEAGHSGTKSFCPLQGAYCAGVRTSFQPPRACSKKAAG